MSLSRLRQRIAGTLVASVVALGAVLLVMPSPAMAATGPHYWMYTDDSSPNGGRVDFWSNGDIVQLCDVHADGAHADLMVYDKSAGGELRYHITASGSGVCNTVRASDGGWYDLPEAHCFLFVIKLYDGRVSVESEDRASWRNYNDAKANC
ncbi:hypothetical protein AB0I28_16775 [Phytomonospora sp. NPDC050363]|uniref:hypothetical protein n=1 Tax=Phytomonospora sp. NPDC050363 TaxID=3155642 RepID=UPI003401C86B